MEKYGTVQRRDTGQVRAGLRIKGWEGRVRDISFISRDFFNHFGSLFSSKVLFEDCWMVTSVGLGSGF